MDFRKNVCDMLVYKILKSLTATVSVCDDEMVMFAQQSECTSCPWPVHLKIIKRINFMLRIFYQNFKDTNL